MVKFTRTEFAFCVQKIYGLCREGMNMAEKKLLFVYNPHAGKELIKNKISGIVQIFSDAGYDISIYPTRERMDATKRILRDGEAYDLVVCSGGDGTLNESVEGLMQLAHPPVCGYIPAGTVNDFASSLKIPKNMMRAAQTIVDGKPFACDFGSCNQRYFTYFAGFGAFTEVSYDTPQAYKNLLGKMAYILEGMKRVPNIQSYHAVVEHDGERLEDDFIFAMVTNSHSVAGIKGFYGKKVKLDDGLFEVLLIKMPKNILDLQTIMNAMIAKEQNEYMHFFRTDSVKFTSETTIPWTLDGEFGGDLTEAEIKNHNRALSILIPDEEK